MVSRSFFCFQKQSKRKKEMRFAGDRFSKNGYIKQIIWLPKKPKNTHESTAYVKNHKNRDVVDQTIDSD